MKVSILLTALLFSICRFSSFAQITPKLSGSDYLIFPSKPMGNDERMVLKVTDSISKIRVAKMSSADKMPGSFVRPQPIEGLYPLGLNTKNPSALIYILRAGGKEIPLSQASLDLLKSPKWKKNLSFTSSRDSIKKYNEKADVVVFVSLRDSVDDFLKEIGDR